MDDKKTSKGIIPKAPAFSLAVIGPGVVLVAMGLGSGEYILWPNIVAQFGFGVLWGAVVGVSFQFLFSGEAARYTLATGGSIYTAIYKLNKNLPWWFIVSTFASFAWPGIIGSAGEILGYMLGVDDHKWLTVVMLLAIGLILTFGGKVYNNIERFQKLVVVTSIPVLVVIAIIVSEPDTPMKVAQGLVGSGEGYWFLPAGISIPAFLGAMAYAGAGGNLLLSSSFYVQDEGLGMASNVDSQVKRGKSGQGMPAQGKSSAQGYEPIMGEMLSLDNANLTRFRGWMRLFRIEQFLTFWLIGVGSIILLTIIAYELVYPYSGEGDLNFIFAQEQALTNEFSAALGLFFIVIGVVFLFKTQLGVYETTSRIMSENIQLLLPGVRRKYSRSTIFYGFLWAQIVAAAFISIAEFEQPLTILLISTFFSAVSMAVLSLVILALNLSKHIPVEIKPPKWSLLIQFSAVIFYSVFVAITLADFMGWASF